MRASLLRFPSAVVVAMLVAVELAACPATAWAENGHWRLHAIRRTMPEKLEYFQKGILLSFRISSRPRVGGMITQMEFFPADKPRTTVDKYVIAWDWSAIPVVVRPGDEIPMTIKGTVAEHPTWEKGFVGHCYPFMKVEFWRPGPDEWDLIGRFTDAIVQFSSSDAKKKSDLAKTVGSVPAGRAGEELALVVNIEHPNEIRWDWAYVYIWDSAPPPTSVPDPIPAGQTTLDGGGGEETGRDRGEVGDKGRTQGEVQDTSGDDDDPLPGEVSSMTLQADRRTVKAGGTVTVPIRLLRARNVSNLDYKVQYDPSVVRPKGKAIPGNLLDNASMQSNPADRGRIWIAFATIGSISGNGTVAQIPFEAVGQPGQKTVLELEVTIFNESTDSSQITKIPGEIEILTASGRLRGDMNGNEIIDAADAMEALKMAVKLIPMNLDADMDDDKTVTSADARILLRKAMEQ